MHIGEVEELILLAIQGLGDDAYGVPVREAVKEAGRDIAVGTLYVTTERLEAKGLIESWYAEVTPTRGGKAKRHFRLTGAGKRALDQAELTRSRLRVSPQLAGGMA